MAGAVLEACFLNIVATPHPKGVYRRILDLAAEKARPILGRLQGCHHKASGAP